MVGEIIEINCCRLCLLKLDALYADLGVLGLAFLQIARLPLHLVDAAFLVRFILLDQNDVFQTKFILIM